MCSLAGGDADGYAAVSYLDERVGEVLPALRSTRIDLDRLDGLVRASQRERDLVSRALRQGRYTSWDFVPDYEATTQYVRNREDLYELQRRAARGARRGADLAFALSLLV